MKKINFKFNDFFIFVIRLSMKINKIKLNDAKA